MKSHSHPAESQLRLAPTYSDEIDLVELCANVWNSRWKVIFASGLSLALAVVYLIVTPDYYKLETILAPPLIADLEPIQPPSEDADYTLSRIKPNEIYGLLKGYLQSEEQQLGFWSTYHGFDALKIDDASRQAFLAFRQSLTFSFGKKGDPSVTVTMLTAKPDGDVTLLADFIRYANKEVLKSIVQRMERMNAIQKSRLESDIARMKTQYEVELMDQIALLKEDLTIARKNGLTDTSYEQLANIEITVLENRYLLGVRLLTAQLEALIARQGNAAFVPGLRDLESQLKKVTEDFGALKENQGEARAFMVLRPLARPQEAEKPKRILVLTVSVLGGSILGLFWIFMNSLSEAIRLRNIVSVT